MRVSIHTYISNIIDVLAKVVLPGVNSAFARIQLSYAIDLMNQLQNMVEYRNDVMKDDYAAAKEILDLVCAVLNDNHVNLPEEITSYAGMASSDQTPVLNMEKALTQVETASAKALELMYQNDDEINNFNEIENKLLDLSLHWVRRKAELKAPTINLELLESG
jgi:hypothetical protein